MFMQIFITVFEPTYFLLKQSNFLHIFFIFSFFFFRQEGTFGTIISHVLCFLCGEGSAFGLCRKFYLLGGRIFPNFDIVIVAVGDIAED